MSVTVFGSINMDMATRVARLASLAKETAMAAALRLACAAAPLSIQRIGAAASMPMRVEVEAAVER